MFFIAPKNVPGNSTLDQPISKRKRVVPEEIPESDSALNYYQKRIPRACDRCRLKKTKCSGGNICRRCKQDGVVCVTTTMTKKGDHTQHPDYVHLVESQRDQLAQALHKVLQNDGTADAARLRTLLAEMGIATDSLRSVRDSQAPTHQAPDLVSQTAPAPISWEAMFNSLNDPQLQAIESFCATTPQMQNFFFDPATELMNEQYQSMNPNENSTGMFLAYDLDYEGMGAEGLPWAWESDSNSSPSYELTSSAQGNIGVVPASLIIAHDMHQS